MIGMGNGDHTGGMIPRIHGERLWLRFRALGESANLQSSGSVAPETQCACFGACNLQGQIH